MFLLGHSMGGLITSCYLLDHQADFRGAVISAPLIKASGNISQATIIIGKILSALAPRMGLLVAAHGPSEKKAAIELGVH